MKVYTKEESKLIVNHAASCLKTLGDTQNKLCIELEIDGGYFSKCKQGKKRLNDNSLTLLVERFGYPRIGKGLFVKAEHYLGLDSFLDGYNETQEARFVNSQIRLWKNKEFITNLIERLVIVTADGTARKDKENNAMRQLQLMLKDEAFKNWFDLYEHNPARKSILQKLSGDDDEIVIEPSLDDVLSEYSVFFRENSYKEVFLQRLGLMEYGINAIASFDIQNQPLCDVPSQNELVVSGELIFNERFSTNTFIDRTVNKFEDFLAEFNLDDVDHSLRYFDKSIEAWSGIELTVYLGTELGYHFLLTFKGEEDRVVVITLENNNEIISALSKVYSFLGADESDYFSIKEALAVAGAYIPGAILLT